MLNEVHVASTHLLEHVRPRGLRDSVNSIDVHPHYEVPVFIRHSLECLVSQNAGVVDHNIHPSKRLQERERKSKSDRQSVVAISHDQSIGWRRTTTATAVGKLWMC